MNEDGLKLTTYFGERDRDDGRLLADALLDIYGSHRLRASILLRAGEGFGRLHHLRTDRQLSLSEDLSMMAIAVDRHDRIQALVPAVREVTHKGLLVLERARLLGGELAAVELPESLHEATKLTVYVGRRERIGRVPAYVAVCDLLHRRGVAGAAVLLGVDGTVAGRRARARFFAANADVPIQILAVGAGEVIAGVLPELGERLRDPLVTLERVRVCKRDGERLATPHRLPDRDARGFGLWQKLMVYGSQATTVRGRSQHLEIVQRLREAHAAGATTLRGIWGFHGDHPPHGDRLLSVRRHVPVVTIAVDTPQRTAEAFAIIDELTTESGLVTCEMVPAMSALSAERTIGGLTLADHDF